MDSADAMCITRIAQGDPHALDELYLQFRPSLYRYLFHQLHGDASLVEEVLQFATSIPPVAVTHHDVGNDAVL